jgi:alpha-tubulin suppressor-like RCC1 family protein
VGALTNWAQVSLGYNFGAAVKTDGTLWTWGANAVGQLGLGNTTIYSSPVQVGSNTNWSNVNCNVNCMLAIKTDNTIWAWGGNGVGQLGLGNITSYSSPKQIGALTNWASVSNRGSQTAFNTTVAVKTNNTLWGWGRNNSGAIGLGNTTAYSSPKQSGANTFWATVVCGGNQNATISIRTNGTLWSWGANNGGQLASGNTVYNSSAAQVGALATWVAIGIASGNGLPGSVFGIKSA